MRKGDSSCTRSHYHWCTTPIAVRFLRKVKKKQYLVNFLCACILTNSWPATKHAFGQTARQATKFLTHHQFFFVLHLERCVMRNVTFMT